MLKLLNSMANTNTSDITGTEKPKKVILGITGHRGSYLGSKGYSEETLNKLVRLVSNFFDTVLKPDGAARPCRTITACGQKVPPRGRGADTWGPSPCAPALPPERRALPA